MPTQSQDFQFLDFDHIPGIPCPCGTAKRGLMDVESVPYSLHITEISETARAHYHKRLTETYFVLECDQNAEMELNGSRYPLRPHSAVVIHPGTRHRAIGKMKVVIVASPKFDPSDEWFDD